jgi:uncharacterized YigZ family protein
MSNIKDTYRTLGQAGTGEFRDRGSKFIGYAAAAYDEEEWKAQLEEVKKLHPKARHHCYAFRMGLEGHQFRANDDGEPSGTAGRPILGQIDRLELTNVMVIVVRYFGGTLLGTSGLINAYRESAALALEDAEVIERTVEEVYRLSFDYSLMGNVMSSIENLQLNMIGQDFGNTGQVDIAIRRSEVEPTLKRLKAAIAEVYLEEVEQMESIEGLTISRQGER